MLRRIRLFLEMIRFSHTVFALPFAMLSATLAWHRNLAEGREFRPRGWRVFCCAWCSPGRWRWHSTVLSIAGSTPPIPARPIDTFQRACSASLRSWRFAWCAPPHLWRRRCCTCEHLPLWLSVPVLAFLCGYSFAKRFTALCHYWLGRP